MDLRTLPALALIAGFVVSARQATAQPAVQPADAPAAAATAAKPADKAAAPAGLGEIDAPTTVEQVYDGAGLRDPFIPLIGAGGGGGGSADVSKLPPPTVQALVLKGVLASKGSGFALIEDSATGARYVLKADGKLYDVMGKAVPDVSGSIISAKSVRLKTASDNLTHTLELPK